MNKTMKRLMVIIQQILVIVFMYAGAAYFIEKYELTEVSVFFYIVALVPALFMVRILDRWGSFE